MLLFCVFIYKFICARVFKCILNYVLIQQNMKQILLDSPLELYFKTVTFTLEKFKCIFYLLLENWEMSRKLQKNNKMAKNTFSFFLYVEYQKNKFAIFSVSLYVFYDLMCYRWLKICYKELCELMFIYVLWFNML